MRAYRDEDEGSIYDVLEDPTINSPLEALSLQDLKGRLAEAIRELPEKEQLVLALYYDEDLNLKEIGEVLGITESRVSQIRTQAILRMRNALQDTTSHELLIAALEHRSG